MTDDGTPQALPEWETGPHRDPSDPHVYLADEPTLAERRLADVLDREAADEHIAKIAIRGWGHALWIRGADGFARRLRRWLLAAAALAAGNLSAVGYYLLNRHDEAVAAKVRAAADEQVNDERRAATNRAIDELQKDIRELRAALQRFTGADPLPSRAEPSPPSGAVFALPDKVSISSPKEPHHDLASHP